MEMIGGSLTSCNMNISKIDDYLQKNTSGELPIGGDRLVLKNAKSGRSFPSAANSGRSTPELSASGVPTPDLSNRKNPVETN